MEKAEEIFSLVRSDVSTELDCSVSVQSLSDNTAELKNLDCTTLVTVTDKLVWNGCSCRIVENCIYLLTTPIRKKHVFLSERFIALSNVQFDK